MIDRGVGAACWLRHRTVHGNDESPVGIGIDAHRAFAVSADSCVSDRRRGSQLPSETR